MTRGRLIALEGGEASGKSTQAARLAGRRGALLTREPGGTPLGEAVRALLLDPTTAGIDARAEALLMAAARAQHVADVIEPALAAGRDVVTDRYVGSSLAYQGHGRGLGAEEVAALSRFAAAPEPDVVVLLDVSDAVAAERASGRALDRFEGEDASFHRRVIEGFRALAASGRGYGRWVVVDGNGAVDEVEERVAAAVDAALVEGAP